MHSETETDSSDDEYFNASSTKYTEPEIFSEESDSLDYKSDKEESREDVLTQEEREIREDHKIAEEEKSMSPETLSTRRDRALSLKVHGNRMFVADRLAYASMYYTAALRLLPAEYLDQRAIFHSNRAAVFVKTKDIEHAIRDCTSALRYNPDYRKPLMRRAVLREQLEEYEDSLKDYEALFEKNPADRDVYYKMQYLKTVIEEKNEKLKEEMMAKLKDLGNMCLKPFGLSTDNFKMKKDPNTGSYSVNFQQ